LIIDRKKYAVVTRVYDAVRINRIVIICLAAKQNLMINGPSWERIATFLSVARSGSLSAAARELRVSQPTVRRDIEKLEQELGVRLFTRSPAGLIPADTALALLPHAEQMESIHAAMVRAARASGETIAGPVRITASEIMAVHVLPELIAPLLARNPQLSVELVATNAVGDLLNRDADIAVRMIRPRQSGLIARRVGEIAIGLFATQTYLDIWGDLTHETLTEHRFVSEDRLGDQASMLAAAGIEASALSYAFRSDSDSAQLAAVAAGVGIGSCHATELAKRLDLVRVMPDFDIKLEIWLVAHADLRDQPRIRAVLDHLGKSLRAYATGAAF
jgi:DNA-binding transcriptional LysR family regulator